VHPRRLWFQSVRCRRHKAARLPSSWDEPPLFFKLLTTHSLNWHPTIEHAVVMTVTTVFCFVNITARVQTPSYASSRHQLSASQPGAAACKCTRHLNDIDAVLDRTTRQYLPSSNG
jgi:hypothetical protein